VYFLKQRKEGGREGRRKKKKCIAFLISFTITLTKKRTNVEKAEGMAQASCLASMKP
jgi:hypothetical protein